MRRKSRPSDSITFLVDRSLGRHTVVDALRLAGERVEALDDHFPQNAADVVWLSAAGRRGWIVLTKDLAISRNSFERQMLLHSGVRAFILSRQNVSGAEMAKLFVDSLPKMRRYIMQGTAPFIYGISRSGQFTRLA